MNIRIGYWLRVALGVEKKLKSLHVRIRDLEELIYNNQAFSTAAKGTALEERTVIPFLTGGLGNQFFQIACAYALARSLNAKCMVNYELYATQGQGTHPRNYKDTIYRNLKETSLIPDYTYAYHSPPYKEIRVPLVDVKLEGFFQSSKYFKLYREEVRHLFSLPQPNLQKAKDYLNQDSTRPTVGVHIRLGDYLKHPGLQAFGKDYYLRATKFFPANSRFIICSDEPDLAYDLLKAKNPEIYRGESEIADLALLSSCSNLIMSNSTFSYWAYFLGTHKALVVAPKRWFNKSIHQEDHSDIYEKEWKLT